jgi:hypothetical protein
MTQFKMIPDYTLSITCGLCKHHSMLEVAKLVLGGDATAHEVRQKFRCQKCGAKGNNTYQIVWWGKSGVALDGAGVKPATV